MHTLAQLQSGELSGLTRLKLAETLTEFPTEILTLADTLKILDLTGNQLNALPEEFGQLKKLKILFLSENLFTELPAVLGACPELEMIGHSEEHLVARTNKDHRYQVGDVLYGLAFHICPTCALYERAIVVKNGVACGEWRITGRDRKINV